MISPHVQDLQGKYPALKVCPLYATLPSINQMEAFNAPGAGTRKVILSTNIAETSVTIDGIRYVIDCGRVKARCFSSCYILWIHSNLVGGIQMIKIEIFFYIQDSYSFDRNGYFTGTNYCTGPSLAENRKSWSSSCRLLLQNLYFKSENDCLFSLLFVCFHSWFQLLATHDTSILGIVCKSIAIACCVLI